jgi:hypothetical protein
VSEQLEDPFKSPWLLGDVLTQGKHCYDALAEQPDFRSAQLVIGGLRERELAALAFYVAAEQIAREVERTSNFDYWVGWWKGLDPDPEAIDARPQQLWKIMRPPTEDESDSSDS